MIYINCHLEKADQRSLLFAVQAIAEMDRAAQQSAALVEQAHQLVRLVGVFKVERDHAAAPVRMAGKRKQSKLTLVSAARRQYGSRLTRRRSMDSRLRGNDVSGPA
jgi:hypothetical protein